MPVPLLAAGLLICCGVATLTGALLLAQRHQSEKERRFSLVSPTRKEFSVFSLFAARGAEQIGKLDGKIKNILTFGSGYSWGMHASTPALILIALISGSAASFITCGVLGLSIWLAVPAFVGAAFFVPRSILRQQQAKAEHKFINLFPDAVDMVARMLRGGMPITYAMRIVGNEAPPPVNKAFSMIADQIKIGIPIGDALDACSREIALPDFRFFAVTAIIQNSTGGNLIATLEELSQIMRRRQAMRLKAKAVSAEVRFSAYVLTALPFLIVAALLVIEPDYLSPLFNERGGHLILAIAGGGLFLSFFSMHQITRSLGRGK